MSRDNETIAAIATPPGRGGIGVVRISGPLSKTIAQTLLDVPLQPRQATLAKFKDSCGDTLDRGIALFFPAPHSYTGEDVLELQAHGGPVLLNLLLRSALEAGARQARAGEFTERAFNRGQLDLSQAEAVADLIDASSERAVRAARRSLEGTFSKYVDAITEGLIKLRVQIEAGLDFAEDAPGVLATEAIAQILVKLIEDVKRTRTAAQCGRRLRDGFKVVIAGAANVGKSSLLNRLSGTDAAIVTSIPGTTRDPVSETIILDGLMLELTDTAGLRDSHDVVEKIGIQRALEHARQADLVLLVFDDPHHGPDPHGRDLQAGLMAGNSCLFVQNKSDLTHDAGAVWPGAIAVSATTGDGIDILLAQIKHHAGAVAAEGEFSARQRHVSALDRAGDCLESAHEACRLGIGIELIAEDLRMAQLALDGISGKVTSDDLLGQIFSSFCIGK